MTQGGGRMLMYDLKFDEYWPFISYLTAEQYSTPACSALLY